MTEKQIQESGLLDRYTRDQILHYQPIVDHLVESVLIGLSDAERERFRLQVAVGSLDTGEMNAIIVRADCGFYAILLHYGLFLFLDKYFKYLHGYYSPASIAYCSAGDVAQLTSSDYMRFASELVDGYKDLLSPFGPLVKLKESAQPMWWLHTHFCKLFVLCHELGHLFNGDLDKQGLLTPFKDFPDVVRLEENRDHQKEYAADVWGYGRMNSVVHQQAPAVDDHLVLGPIIMLFRLFFMLGGGASVSHPHPLERIKRIADDYYDAAFRDEMIKMYREAGVTMSIFGPDEEMA